MIVGMTLGKNGSCIKTCTLVLRIIMDYYIMPIELSKIALYLRMNVFTHMHAYLPTYMPVN